MPNSIVTHLIERVAKLEAKVESLLTYQKWTMALISALLMTSIGAIFAIVVKH